MDAVISTVCRSSRFHVPAEPDPLTGGRTMADIGIQVGGHVEESIAVETASEPVPDADSQVSISPSVVPHGASIPDKPPKPDVQPKGETATLCFTSLITV